MINRYLLVLAIVLLLFTSTSLFINAQPSPAPRVWSITSQTQTQSTITTFVVTFNEAVTGVDITDFSTSGDDQSAQVVHVQPDDIATTYYVDVALTGPTTGLLLILIDNDSIMNAAGIPLGNSGLYNGNATSDAVVVAAPTSHTTSTPPSSSQAMSLQPRIGGIDVGKYNDIVLTSNDIPIISYYDATNGDLKLSVCDTRACTSPTIKTIDSIDDVGQYTSIALTSADIPIISYYDATNGDLKLAICNNTACTAPTIRVVDNTADVDVGSHSSMALTSTDRPVMSYYDATNRDLWLAVCDDSSCASPVLTRVDNYWDVGNYTSIAINSSDQPIISYFYDSYGDLKMAICNTLICDDPEIKVMDNSANTVGMNTSITLANDVPVIVYYDTNARKLKMAYCNDSNCMFTTNEVIADNVYAYQNAIASSPSGKAFIAYGQYIEAETSWTLQLINCYGIPPCALPVRTNGDFDRGITGFYHSIAIDSNDVPVVSYYDNGNNELRLYRGTSFIDQGQPNTFGKSSPTNNLTLNTSTVALTWQTALNATSYEYCYATSIDTCTDWTSTTNTSATISSLTHDTTYYWQVRALNAAGTTIADNNTFRQFTIFLPPDAFTKSQPTNNMTLNTNAVTLTWQPSTYATSYEYCVATTIGTCTNWKSTTNTSMLISSLAHNTSYFWQVRAKNNAGTIIADTNAFNKFTIFLPPGRFTKLQPANNASSIPVNPTLTWNTSLYAATYEYCLSTTTSCSNWRSVGANRSVTLTGLSRNKAYYWQVRAKNAAGTTVATDAIRKFTTIR